MQVRDDPVTVIVSKPHDVTEAMTLGKARQALSISQETCLFHVSCILRFLRMMGMLSRLLRQCARQRCPVIDAVLARVFTDCNDPLRSVFAFHAS